MRNFNITINFTRLIVYNKKFEKQIYIYTKTSINKNETHFQNRKKLLYVLFFNYYIILDL